MYMKKRVYSSTLVECPEDNNSESISLEVGSIIVIVGSASTEAAHRSVHHQLPEFTQTLIYRQ